MCTLDDAWLLSRKMEEGEGRKYVWESDGAAVDGGRPRLPLVVGAIEGRVARWLGMIRKHCFLYEENSSVKITADRQPHVMMLSTVRSLLLFSRTLNRIMPIKSHLSTFKISHGT
jgi:hypothetical protein